MPPNSSLVVSVLSVLFLSTPAAAAAWLIWFWASQASEIREALRKTLDSTASEEAQA